MREIVQDGKIADKFIDAFASQEPVALLLGNETYNAFCFRIDEGTDEQFDFDVLMADNSSVDSTVILPEYVVRETLSRRLQPINDICAVTKIDALVMGPPPTKDESVLQATHARKRTTKLWMARPYARLKCWKIQREVMRGIAKRNSILFIDIPNGAADEDGFLKAEFNWDGIHGNPDYSVLMLNHIISQMEAA